jgi:hypothetical protein
MNERPHEVLRVYSASDIKHHTTAFEARNDAREQLVGLTPLNGTHISRTSHGGRNK